MAINVSLLLLLLGVVQISAQPPPHQDLAKRARYIVHKADWCIMTTISTDQSMLGRPFSTPTSVSDGPIEKGSGIPYIFQPTVSNVYQDIVKNDKVTFAFSEAEFGLDQCLLTPKTDPEWPMCARLTLLGDMSILKDPAKIATAKEALFSRHPSMPSWGYHDWVFMDLNITRILLLDYFGGWNVVSVDDYFNA